MIYIVVGFEVGVSQCYALCTRVVDAVFYSEPVVINWGTIL